MIKADMLASGEQGLLVQGGRLWPSCHHVHVLHRLARGALDQIVDDRNQNGPTRYAIGEDADETMVGTAHWAGARRLARRQYAHEGLAGVTLGKLQAKALAGRPLGKSDIDGREN